MDTQPDIVYVKLFTVGDSKFALFNGTNKPLKLGSGSGSGSGSDIGPGTINVKICSEVVEENNVVPLLSTMVT